MFIAFEKLPDEARVWVYQAEKELNSDEQQLVVSIGQRFIEQWVTHGQPLIGSIAVLEGHFVVIAVNDRQLPSGCSIDASVGLMRDLGNQLNVDFFGRTNVPLWTGNAVQIVSLVDLKNNIKEGAVSSDTKLINTLIQSKGELSEWVIPIKNSWLARYLPQPHNN